MNRFVSLFHDYQKERGVVGRCFDNTRFICDLFENMFGGKVVRPQVGIVVWKESETDVKCLVHCWVDTGGGNITDYSYEVRCNGYEKEYFRTVTDLLKRYPQLKRDKSHLKYLREKVGRFKKDFKTIDKNKNCTTDYYKQLTRELAPILHRYLRSL